MEKAKIILVDEQQEYRSVCAEKLEETGYQISASTSDPMQALDCISKIKPEVVLFDIVLSPIDGPAFLKEAKAVSPDTHYIAVSSIAKNNIIRETMQAGADYYIIKPFDFNVLSERINRVCAQKSEKNKSEKDEDVRLLPGEPDLEAQVTEIILEIGIPAHVKGYHYVRTAIIMAIENPSTLNAVTKIIYPEIAESYGTSPSRVERAIRHAIEVAWDRGDIDVLNGIFGYSVNCNRGKPTNSEFIAMLADRIRLKNKPNAGKITVRI